MLTLLRAHRVSMTVSLLLLGAATALTLLQPLLPVASSTGRPRVQPSWASGWYW